MWGKDWINGGPKRRCIGGEDKMHGGERWDVENKMNGEGGKMRWMGEA